ncbi:MAG: hypothetical protein V7647_253, partial [Acidobacteriota bacterium]
MMSAAVLNLVAWSLQVAILVAAAALSARLLHVDAAGARYALWRLVLAGCLALPLLQPWQGREPLRGMQLSVNETGSTSSPLPAARAGSAGSTPRAAVRSASAAGAVAITVVLGAAFRLAWLTTGLCRLRRLRHLSAASRGVELAGELQTVMNVHADVRLVTTVGQPVTFGLRRPVVLLPASLARHPVEIQRAVVVHELWHVRRRDWAWVVAEEAVRSVLWFNPALWWLISRVQSCREEVVDELTVLVTNGRRSYLQALLAFAEAPLTFPATPFAARRHLFTRMLLVSKEASMSSTRIVGSCAGVLLVVTCAAAYAASAFPLTPAATAGPATQGQMPPRDLRRNEPRPATAREVRLQATVKAGSADPAAWLELATLQEQRGATAEAESTLIGMRAATPGSRQSYDALARLYSRNNQFDRAIGVLEEAIALAPSDPSGHQVLVTFLAEKTRDLSLTSAERLAYARKGIAGADSALAVDPYFVDALVYKSLLLRTQAGLEPDRSAQQRLLREAEAVRSQALALRSTSPRPASSGRRSDDLQPPPPPPPPP